MATGTPKQNFCFVLISLAGIILAGSWPALRATYLDKPPPGHTGGFGEKTCLECHSDYPLNDPEGRILLEGLPGVYVPNQQYSLSLRLERPGLQRAGFQMSARFQDGDPPGLQAGHFQASNPRIQVTGDPSHPEYAGHTELGGEAVGEGVHRWELVWQAPHSEGTVVFHIAANAGNDDESPLGDFIYTHRVVTKSAEGNVER